jgi:hypothetical protein
LKSSAKKLIIGGERGSNWGTKEITSDAQKIMCPKYISSSEYNKEKQNRTAQAATLLARIREVSISKLGGNADSPERFSRVSAVLQSTCQDSILN